MFCFSCKYTSNSPLDKCIDSILEFHPDEKIVVVDSESDDKTYYQRYQDNDKVIILDNVNKYRQPGSFEVIYEKYPNEPYYVMIHDSLVLKKSFQKFIDSESEFYSLMYFSELTQPAGDRHLDFYEKIFADTLYKSPGPREQIVGSFGPMAIIKNSLMKRMKESGLMSKFKSTSKWEDNNCERVLGMWAAQEGYYPETYNIEGDFIANYNRVMSDELEYFTKIILGRQ